MNYIDAIIKVWTDGEEPLVDEIQHTPWAEPGWLAWNGSSPELEFAQAAGRLSAHVDGMTLETGVSRGYITRRLDPPAIVYESNDEIRNAIADYIPDDITISPNKTPGTWLIRRAGLVVIDSSRPYRLSEASAWAEHGTGLLLVHDCGNGHDKTTSHMRMRQHLRDLGLRGILTGNPRGGALCWKNDKPDLDVLGLPVLGQLHDG